MKEGLTRWAVKWHSKNKLNGTIEYFIFDGGAAPVLFYTKREALEFIKEHYSYIAKRKDLRDEPHGWRVPKAVRVTVTIQTLENKK